MSHRHASRPKAGARLAAALVVVVGLTAAVLATHAPWGTASTSPDGQGYWLVASDGGIFSFGSAAFHGSTSTLPLNRPIVGMAATPDGRGYWLVASDGGIFSGGDATFHGSTGAMVLNRPIVGMAATPDGRGYWLVASDGGVFSFGDARFHGALGGGAPHRPIVGMAAAPGGQGYWLAAADGGVYAFGDATFHGALGPNSPHQPIVGMAGSPDGQGYRLAASGGGVYSFGDAGFHGSAGSLPLRRPVVGIAATSVADVANTTGMGGSAGTGSALCGSRSGRPTTSKLLVVWEENASASSVYGSPQAPNMNAYTAACGKATDYVSLGHPSLPNYLEATSGLPYNSSPWTSDCQASSATCRTAADNIFNQVGPGRWKGYAQSMPSPCAQGSSGPYLPRHNPAVYYTDLGASCAADDVNIGTPTAGDLHDDIANGTLPTFGTITPDVNNDQHNGTESQADAYLASWIPQIVAGPDYRSGRLAIVIVYDEGAGSGTNSPSTVAAIVLSPFVVPGTVSAAPFTHYSLLAAAEDIAGVPRLGNAASAGNLRAAFGF
jgi:hypothetical protein